jgi:Plavaka transposase
LVPLTIFFCTANYRSSPSIFGFCSTCSTTPIFIPGMGRRHRRDGVTSIISRHNALKQSTVGSRTPTNANDSRSESDDDDVFDFFGDNSTIASDDHNVTLEPTAYINAEIMDSDVIRRLTFDDFLGDESDSFEESVSDPNCEELPVFSGTDRAMIQIYQYAMQQGTSLGFIDNLFGMIRKFSKENGFDVHKAPLRQTFLKRLRRKMVVATPLPTCVDVPLSRSCLPKFLFLEQLQDLMSSSEFTSTSNLVVNIHKEPSCWFGKYVTPAGQEQLEVHSGSWYNRTYDELITNPHLDLLMPIIFYIDKTGTDVMQRFPLEPLMFSTTLLKREIREKASAWRHLGFVPPCDDAAATAESSMQSFHNCLSTLLSGLVELQRNPPTVEFSVDNRSFRKRLLLPVAFVIGDQLSQDKHCGRKSVNGGGAGRAHRQCMCSCLNASATSSPCKPVRKDVIDELTRICHQISDVDSLMPDQVTPASKKRIRKYIARRSRCARMILGSSYSMYPVKNGWSDVCFGSNKNGIHRATLDDPMHYLDGGSFLYLAQVTCLSMTETERYEMETVIKSYFQSKRSSVRQDLPRAKFASGFTRTTLLTAGEKIGLILSLYVAIGTPKGRSIFEKVIARTQQKYLRGVGLDDDLPHRNDVYFFSDLRRGQRVTETEHYRSRLLDRTAAGVQELLHLVIDHDLYFVVEDMLRTKDELQLEYFLQAVNSCLLHTSSRDGFPTRPVVGVYSGSNRLSIRNRRFPPVNRDCRVILTFLRQPNKNSYLKNKDELYNDTSDDEILEDEGDNEEEEDAGSRYQKLAKTFEIRKDIPKHGLVRPPEKGTGPTSAILTDCDGYRCLSEKILSMHSFIHFFASVPLSQRTSMATIQRAVNGLVSDYSKIIYRGDNSVDCSTGKIHSHLHLASDIAEFGEPMNWEASKGERGLKVWAKLASGTAQKHNLSLFTNQTALRVADVLLLSKASSTITIHSGKVTETVKVTESEAPIPNPPEAPIPNPPEVGRSFWVQEIQLRRHPHALVKYHEGVRDQFYAVSRKGKETLLDDIPLQPFVFEALRKVEAENHSSLQIYKDATLICTDQKIIIRSWSEYDSFGSFFDWVMVEWKFERSDKYSTAPAKVLLIYEDTRNELCAIVQACCWQSVQEISLSNTISSRWMLELEPAETCSRKRRILRKISLKDIVGVLYVIEHSGTQPKFGIDDQFVEVGGDEFVDVIHGRCEWTEHFLGKPRGQSRMQRGTDYL